MLFRSDPSDDDTDDKMPAQTQPTEETASPQTDSPPTDTDDEPPTARRRSPRPRPVQRMGDPEHWSDQEDDPTENRSRLARNEAHPIHPRLAGLLQELEPICKCPHLSRSHIKTQLRESIEPKVLHNAAALGLMLDDPANIKNLEDSVRKPLYQLAKQVSAHMSRQRAASTETTLYSLGLHEPEDLCLVQAVRCLCKFYNTSPVMKALIESTPQNHNSKSPIRALLRHIVNKTASFQIGGSRVDVTSSFPPEIRAVVARIKPRTPRGPVIRPYDPAALRAKWPDDGPMLDLKGTNQPTTRGNFPQHLLYHALNLERFQESTGSTSKLYHLTHRVQRTEQSYDKIMSLLQLSNSRAVSAVTQIRNGYYSHGKMVPQPLRATRFVEAECHCGSNTHPELRDTAYHLLVECPLRDDLRVLALEALMRKLKSSGLAATLTRETLLSELYRQRASTLERQLRALHPPFSSTAPLLDPDIANRRARAIGVDLEEEYELLTRLRGVKRSLQHLRMYDKIILAAWRTFRDTKSYSLLADPNLVQLHRAKTFIRGRQLGLRIANGLPAQVNSVLRDLVPTPDHLGNLVAPDPSRHSPLTQVILYGLTYYMVVLDQYHRDRHE